VTTLRPLEEIDPLLMDQAVRRVISGVRDVGKEATIAENIASSQEMREWVQMLRYANDLEVPEGVDLVMMKLLSAFTVGVEVGYDLGQHEAMRVR
jgi:hypothetical protein